MVARWSQAGIQAWWTLILSALRDVAALVVGVWILLFRTEAPATLQGIGFLLLTAGVAGSARTAIRNFLKEGDGGT